MPRYTKTEPPKQVIELKDIEMLKKMKAANLGNRMLVVIFWKKEDKESENYKEICEEMAKVSEFTTFVSVNIEDENMKKISELYEIKEIPSTAFHYVFFLNHNKNFSH